MMNAIQFVTSRGRIDRGTWWALFANAVALPVAAMFIGWSILDVQEGAALAALVSPLSFWVLLTASIKRLHDLNRGGIWLLLMFVPFGWIVLLAWLGTVPGAGAINFYGPPTSGSPFQQPETRMNPA